MRSLAAAALLAAHGVAAQAPWGNCHQAPDTVPFPYPTGPAYSGAAQIAVINWVPRTDWLNVKTFGAKGDGITDDTAAIQAALSLLTDEASPNKTVFMPAGVYKITSTLKVANLQGGNVFGAGRDTTLRWGGPAGNDTAMMWSQGAARFNWIGLTWDGAGVVGVGVDHDSKANYETQIKHENEAFFNFTTAGIRVGHNQTLASAEMLYRNVIFAHSGSGISLLSWNDFDNSIDSALFSCCSYGVFACAGNYYIRNTRFEGSQVADVTVTAHGNSLRRVVSVGSAALVAPGQYLDQSGSALKVHDTRVYNWTGPAAITTVMRGPVQVVDTLFSSPLNASSVAIWNPSENLNPLIISNVTLDGVMAPGIAGQNTVMYEFPTGVVPPTSINAETSFIMSSWPVAQRVFEATTQFGADKTGANDSTSALQACANAAAAAGGGALCYVAGGQFRINASIVLCGTNFEFGGSGYGTMITADTLEPIAGTHPHIATGPGAGCAQSANITISNLQLAEYSDSTRANVVISRAGFIGSAFNGIFPNITVGNAVADSGAVRIIVDGLHSMNEAGTVLYGLQQGDEFFGQHVDGTLSVYNCEDALVFINYMNMGGMGMTVGRMAGASGQHNGFLGMPYLVGASNVFDVYVYNSSSVAIGDYYSETSHSYVYLEGDGASPAGSVTISASKVNTNTGYSMLTAVNYAGRYMHTGGIDQNPPMNVSVTGNAPFALTFVGEDLWSNGSVYAIPPSTNLTTLASVVTNNPNGNNSDLEPDRTWDGSSASVAAGFDDLRLIGKWDFYFNHPELL